MFSWIYSCFIPYLKDFVLVYKFSIKLVRILHFGRVFKYAKLIFKLIFENPYQRLRAVGWATMSHSGGHCFSASMPRSHTSLNGHEKKASGTWAQQESL